MSSGRHYRAQMRYFKKHGMRKAYNRAKRALLLKAIRHQSRPFRPPKTWN